MKSLFPNMSDSLNKEINILLKGEPKEVVACFLATLDIETGGFKYKEENLNYSEASLIKVFPKYFTSDPEVKTKLLASTYARKPQSIANIVYGGRMGNTQPNDGWYFRGRGFIQLTGRNNYTKYEQLMGIPLRTNPELLLDDKYALLSAWLFFKEEGCLVYAVKGDIKSVSGIINTGSPVKLANHLNERTESYEKILAFLNTRK